jgi:hypothetical protein
VVLVSFLNLLVLDRDGREPMKRVLDEVKISYNAAHTKFISLTSAHRTD